MSDDVFSGEPAPKNKDGEPIENYLEHLVGEGKKFQDPEALARGKYESDQFIEDLKRQNQELREDLDRASKLDEILETIRNQNKGEPDPGSGGGDDPASGGSDPNNTRSDLTDEELKSLIESKLSERERQSTAERNLQEVNSTLREKFGEKAPEYLQSIVSDVGMSVDKMKELAAENPKAFYRLVGIDGDKTPNPNVMSNDNRVNSESGFNRGSGPKKDFAYYQELRRKDKNRYFSQAVQQEMFEQRKKMGDAAFYGRE